MGISIAQSVLAALTAKVNRFASSKVEAVHKSGSRRTTRGERREEANNNCMGRRGVLLSTSAAVAAAASQPVDSRTLLLKEYLKKSEENKAKNDKERLDSYYKRNYKDYFELLEGSVQGKEEQQLTESERNIRKWLQDNR